MATRRRILSAVCLSNDLPVNGDNRSARHGADDEYSLHAAVGRLDSTDGAPVGYSRTKTVIAHRGRRTRDHRLPVLHLAHQRTAAPHMGRLRLVDCTDVLLPWALFRCSRRTLSHGATLYWTLRRL